MAELLFPGAGDTLYMQLYEHFRALISTDALRAGMRLPSIRRCAEEYAVSRTTVEAAYMQLAAEGYITPRPQSGYYVCEADFSALAALPQPAEIVVQPGLPHAEEPSSDAEEFDFKLWQRYLKSVLREGDRLLHYGSPQGEPELREAICHYIVRSRSVACTPDRIVIGAGTQSLLHLLYALVGKPAAVAMVGPHFPQGRAVFEDHGATVYSYDTLPARLAVLAENNSGLCYIFPSHMTPDGGVLPIGERMRLLNYARKNHVYIAEDDYDSELLHGRPAPSLQGLDGGECVIYLGTFSKLLLPSIRISFLVLPTPLLPVYRERAALYNQTASKAEQLALSAFLRDGRLDSQIRRLRRSRVKTK